MHAPSSPLTPPACSDGSSFCSTHTSDARMHALCKWLGTHAQRYALDVASCQAVSNDAGARRYFRLCSHASSSDPASFIAVDAPPPEKNPEFIKIAKLFSAAGVLAPQILEQDIEQGFLLLTDLGSVVYIDRLKTLQSTMLSRVQIDPQNPVAIDASGDPANAIRALFDSALDSLILWQRASVPHTLPEYDAALLHKELTLFPQWYLERHRGITLHRAQSERLEKLFTVLIEEALGQPRVFVHRDYMPRNLMVCPGATGVLDFQDAVWGPITYDAISLFRDAFISWDESFEKACLQRYWHRAKAAGLPVLDDFSTFYRALEWMGLQRHLKVLGIFARLCHRDHKPHYLEDAPRFLQYIRQVTQRYPALADLAHLLEELGVLL